MISSSLRSEHTIWTPRALQVHLSFKSLHPVRKQKLYRTPFSDIYGNDLLSNTCTTQPLYHQTRRNPLQPNPIILIKRSLDCRIQIKHPDNPASLVPQRNDDLRFRQPVTRYGDPR
jgi:hypothetical protein